MEKYDIVGDVRGGHGLMTGVEIVSDAYGQDADGYANDEEDSSSHL